ncbi:MAG: hypothetical protein R3A45_08200 [Bdellovibrionota bacterium]
MEKRRWSLLGIMLALVMTSFMMGCGGDDETVVVEEDGVVWLVISAGGNNHSDGRIDRGAHTCGIFQDDNTLWCTGYGGYGQLGNGSVASLSQFTQVGTETDWIAVQAETNFEPVEFVVPMIKGLYGAGVSNMRYQVT